jgi:DNA-directed RNA polymerase specialized sigma24 family protein
MKPLKPTIEDVWNAAMAHAGGVLHGFSVPAGEIAPEDLAGDVVAKYLAYGYIDRFDHTKAKLSTYVVNKMRNMVRDRLQYRAGRPAVSRYGIDEERTSTTTEPYSMLLGDILTLIPDTSLTRKVGGKRVKGGSFKVGGITYTYSVHGILRLVSVGYNFREISKMVGLSHVAVGNIVRRQGSKLRLVLGDKFKEML